MPTQEANSDTPSVTQQKTVLWVDPNLTFESPSMRHLLYSLPYLRRAGWVVKAWCTHSDAPEGEVEHVFFSPPRSLRIFAPIIFFLRVNLHGLMLNLRGQPRPATIIHATCGTYLGANITSVHFLSGLWARRWLALGFTGWKEILGYGMNLWSALCERLQWFSPALRLALPVSDSIGKELRLRVPTRLQIRTMPNSFDETRFNLAVRHDWRQAQRATLGFAADDRVFAFVSMGHHKRKGFWLAVEALRLVRKEGESGRRVRLLVVGGTPSTISRLSKELDERYPDWRQWATLAGMQEKVEKFYAAADAFLFPSYFEAFCLAEIEAAASGLPLLLTPHFGSEMILKDGVNGVKLSFDPLEMSRQIRRFLDEGLSSEFRPGDPGRGLTREEYAHELIRNYDNLLESR